MKKLNFDWSILSDTPPSDEEILKKIKDLSGAYQFSEVSKQYVIDLYRENCGEVDPIRFWLFDKRAQF